MLKLEPMLSISCLASTKHVQHRIPQVWLSTHDAVIKPTAVLMQRVDTSMPTACQPV